jgi:hypothetical protein
MTDDIDYASIEARIIAHAIVKPGVNYYGPSKTGRWPCPARVRKFVRERSCPDDKCMTGLNGKCVACGGEQ